MLSLVSQLWTLHRILSVLNFAHSNEKRGRGGGEGARGRGGGGERIKQARERGHWGEINKSRPPNSNTLRRQAPRPWWARNVAAVLRCLWDT